jgi:hypothetical protein
MCCCPPRRGFCAYCCRVFANWSQNAALLVGDESKLAEPSPRKLHTALDAAIDAYRRAIEAGFRSHLPYMGLAAAYALHGKMDEAKSALAEARRLSPKLTVKWAIARYTNVPPLSVGLRKAGLPEE